MTLEELHCHFVSFAPPDIQVLCDGSTMDHFGVLVQHEWIACIADAIRERNALRQRIKSAPVAIMDTRDALGICAPTEEDFPALYALQGKRVRLVVDEG